MTPDLPEKLVFLAICIGALGVTAAIVLSMIQVWWPEFGKRTKLPALRVAVFAIVAAACSVWAAVIVRWLMG